MQIGGFQKFSLIDYPGVISAVVFLQGCNYRCPYCHNSELVIPSKFRETIPEGEVTSFLLERKERLQGVVVTGGEPTLQEDLLPFLKKIKDVGLKIKLDTNGSRPDVLKKIIGEGLVDLFCMDIKAPFEKYDVLCGTSVNVDDVKRSIQWILASGLDHQFRTTVVKSLLTKEDIQKIPALVEGAQAYVLQNYVYHDGVLEESLLDVGHYNDEEFDEMKESIRWDQSTSLEERPS